MQPILFHPLSFFQLIILPASSIAISSLWHLTAMRIGRTFAAGWSMFPSKQFLRWDERLLTEGKYSPHFGQILHPRLLSNDGDRGKIYRTATWSFFKTWKAWGAMIFAGTVREVARHRRRSILEAIGCLRNECWRRKKCWRCSKKTKILLT